MNAPVSRPCASASDPVDPREGGATVHAAVEALARILDPEAFVPPAKPRDVGVELYRQDRRRVAVLCATRAVAAGYRPLAADGSRADLAAVAHAAGRLDPRTPLSDIPSSYTFVEMAVDAIWAAGYRLVSEEPA